MKLLLIVRVPWQLEFYVQLSSECCGKAVQKKLEELDGIHQVEIDVEKETVVLETTLASSQIIQALELSGRRAVFKGYGTTLGSPFLGAAVAEMKGISGVLGVVRFLQSNENTCIVDGTIDGLTPGDHGIHIHEFGDLTGGCEGVGEHYNPTNSSHGGPDERERHYGDLGNVTADDHGRAVFRKEDRVIKVWDIIGRSLVVTEKPDDLGQGSTNSSKLDGNSGKRLSCGIIARSAGLFENPKKICLCDGISVWNERDYPVAGESRNQKDKIEI
ncbi:copper chaperone for superoxide dismutase-like [Limulus polyphemus]|uniref:Superoxide dismutase copper chaperone n=1 Tax=Limulus polyphemus TaxID=6850 RepID=A0ABM1BXK3_LIMPO|nr:copper chaperone for superoxide dismutase-like [Limulus polyphemus]